MNRDTGSPDWRLVLGYWVLGIEVPTPPLMMARHRTGHHIPRQINSETNHATAPVANVHDHDVHIDRWIRRRPDLRDRPRHRRALALGGRPGWHQVADVLRWQHHTAGGAMRTD